MLIKDGLEFRNLVEQVQKNKEDIAAHYAVDRALSNFGIKIVGVVESTDELPGVTTFPLAPNYPGEFGDGYAVGTPGNYTYYIYTRADLNAGMLDNYWLDVGQISIVGPRGQQGPKGEKGDTGESSKWYAGNFIPSGEGFRDGDMYLQKGGTVWRYNEEGNIWNNEMNIRGPQGIQGIQGLQGLRGEQGPQGEKGDTGDVGGFINIQGILSNVNQLPTPTSLGNLTIAYLVGENNDLYIQVGSTSAEAVWTNVGPINTATLVTVNGEYQNIWNSDTKLEKDIPGSTASNSVRTVYAKNSSGNAYNHIVSHGSTQIAPYRIPLYFGLEESVSVNPNGALATGYPTHDYHATNKQYVDEQVAANAGLPPVTTTTDNKQVYAKDVDGTQIMIDVSTAALTPANSIPMTNENGHFNVRSVNIKNASDNPISAYALKTAMYTVTLDHEAGTDEIFFNIQDNVSNNGSPIMVIGVIYDTTNNTCHNFSWMNTVSSGYFSTGDWNGNCQKDGNKIYLDKDNPDTDWNYKGIAFCINNNF